MKLIGLVISVVLLAASSFAQSSKNGKVYLGVKNLYPKPTFNTTDKYFYNRYHGINLRYVTKKNFFFEVNHTLISKDNNKKQELITKYPYGGYFFNVKVSQKNYCFSSSIGKSINVSALKGLNIYTSIGYSTQFEKRLYYGYFPDIHHRGHYRYSGEKDELVPGAHASLHTIFSVPFTGNHLVVGLYLDQFMFKNYYPRAYGITAGLQIHSFKIRKENS